MASGVEVIILTSDDELDSGHGDCTILPSSSFLQQHKEEEEEGGEEEEEEEEEDDDDEEEEYDEDEDEEDDSDDVDDSDDPDYCDADDSHDSDYSGVDDGEACSQDVSPQSEDISNEFNKLKLDDCKDYLRKYKLRLTGTKSVLVRRIQEHKEITKSGGMAKYPRSSFAKNCTGDACTGDIVFFKQRVYENFDLASRCSKEPPIGKREVAGRIVKESYGAKKQQHTFTLWDNEEERTRILKDKHERGAKARHKRDLRKETKAKHSVQTKNTKSHTARLNKLKGPENKKESHKDGSSSSLSRTERSFLGGVLKMEINSSYVGIIIGKQGRNIKEIERLSGAKLQFRECRDERSRTLEIRGTNDQIHNAKDMVDKFLQSKTGFV